MRRTHEIVSPSPESKLACLGPEGSAQMVSRALASLAGRWKIQILFNLFAEDVLRYSELEKSIPGISQKMLAQQLRELERDGFVERTIYPEVPPRVDYALTATGAMLRDCLRALREVGRQIPVMR